MFVVSSKRQARSFDLDGCQLLAAAGGDRACFLWVKEMTARRDLQFCCVGPVRSLVKDKENNGFSRWKIFLYNPVLIMLVSP